MSQQHQMNMAGMGGPVGGPQMNAGTPGNSGDVISQTITMKRLNTAIYDYMLRNGHWDIARSFSKQADVEVKQEGKPSPNQRGQQANGVDDAMDVDSKETINGKPSDLPLGAIDADFLKDWWCQFWEIWNGHRKPKAAPAQTQQYIAAQRMALQGRVNMLNGNGAPNMRGYNGMVPGVNNGVAMQNDLKRAAMQNQQRMTPQQQQMMKNMQASQQNGQMMQANQMERQGSQMDNMSAQRSGSPGSGDAPSPKRQRLDNMQTMNQPRPGQPGQMGGNQVGLYPSPAAIPPSDPAAEKTRELLRQKKVNPEDLNPILFDNLKNISNPNEVTQAAEVYANSLKAQQTSQMNTKSTPSDMNKGIPPNMGPGGAQGSPMSQAGMDGATGEFYAAANGNNRMAMQNNAANAAGAGQAGAGNGNHALQDYQMQLMLLEQQNKKRLLMARQEQDSMSGSHPGGVGPNGGFQGMSPSGSNRNGDPSPNPNDMQRGMIDPSQMPPQMRQQMLQGGQMARPPSSHPMNLNPQQQMEMMRQQSMQAPNGQFPGAQPPQGMPGQPGQPMGTPRQNNMPPPPAPQANAGGTQPSSPSAQPQPPTPSQANKPKPGTKKETGKKGAAQKKGANAPPATESEAPPTPTPATPITPMNANSFNKNQNMPNGQGPAAAQANNQQQNQQGSQAQPAAQPAAPNNQGDMPFGALDGSDQGFGMPLEFGSIDGGDVLDNFDFDSFLNQDNDFGNLGLDANFTFGDGLENGLDAGNV